jgi:hypothetical protein
MDTCLAVPLTPSCSLSVLVLKCNTDSERGPLFTSQVAPCCNAQLLAESETRERCTACGLCAGPGLGARPARPSVQGQAAFARVRLTVGQCGQKSACFVMNLKFQTMRGGSNKLKQLSTN